MSEVTLTSNHNTDKLVELLESITPVRRGFNRIYKLDDKNIVNLDVRGGVADLISITQNGKATSFGALSEHIAWAESNVGVVTGLAKFHCCNRVHIGKTVIHVPEVVQVERVQGITHGGAHHSQHNIDINKGLNPDEVDLFLAALFAGIFSKR